MGQEFTPIFLLILFAILTAVGMLVTSYIFSPGRYQSFLQRGAQSTSVKQMPYESGMDPVGDTRQRFDVRYYLIAIEFLIFDVEVLLLYPWVVAHWSRDVPGPSAEALAVGLPPELRVLVLVAVLVFLGVLIAGFAYTWRKGVYEWR